MIQLRVNGGGVGASSALAPKTGPLGPNEIKIIHLRATPQR